jgi:hypothetical protein
MAESDPDAADQEKRLSIRVAHRRTIPLSRRVREVPLAIGLATLEELSEELFGYTDVLLGRVEPPIDAGVLTLMEVVNAYLSRAYEVEMLILSAERNREIMKSSAYVKFRTGELRSFIELARKTQELGSRRLTQAMMLADAERFGHESGVE